MRLTCPRCSAQYEIPDQVIPGPGREVECSSCSHVWHQRGPQAPKIVQDSGMIDASKPEYDATARPSLNQPLHDSILSILREETARELSARQPAAHGDPTPRDHIPATDHPAPAPAQVEPTPFEPEDPREIDWPVSTVILPGEPLATVSDDVPTAKPIAAGLDAPAPEPVPPIITPMPPSLPDAAHLAATLTRTTPSAPPPITAKALVDDTFPVETLTEPDSLEIGHASTMRPATEDTSVATPAAPLPVIIPKPPRGSYVMGFGLAVMVALAFVAFYALAPRITPDTAPGMISEWRQGIDQSRLWLNDKARALKGHLAGY